jgi:glycosyltransferase involved in cell wall biosynthesis
MIGSLISVIIPVRNAERFIERTLKSVLTQTYSTFEVIVVDDGSTDRTGAVIESLARRDNRIRLFRGPSAGPSAARNAAAGYAKGGFIAPLDADDLWHPEKLARQMRVMQASSKVGLVYCWSLDIDESDLVVPPVVEKCTAAGDVVLELVARNFLETASVPLIRRSCFEAVGGYDPNLVKGSEDWKLGLALAGICEFGVVPAHLVGYRRSNASMSTHITAMEESIDLVIDWILERWPDLPRNIKRELFSNTNYYLAHKALTADNFISAMRYHIRSVRAKPSVMFSLNNLMFEARFLARVLGVRRAAISFRSPRVSFEDFQPKLPSSCD